MREFEITTNLAACWIGDRYVIASVRGKPGDENYRLNQLELTREQFGALFNRMAKDSLK